MEKLTKTQAAEWLADIRRRSITVGRKAMMNNNPHNIWSMDLLLSTFISAGDVTMEEVKAIEEMQVGETVQFYIFKIKRTV